jgi:hypothetical protein
MPTFSRTAGSKSDAPYTHPKILPELISWPWGSVVRDLSQLEIQLPPRAAPEINPGCFHDKFGHGARLIVGMRCAYTVIGEQSFQIALCDAATNNQP